MRQEAREAASQAGKLGGRGRARGRRRREEREAKARENRRERAEIGVRGGRNWRKRLGRKSEATTGRELEGDKEESWGQRRMGTSIRWERDWVRSKGPKEYY